MIRLRPLTIPIRIFIRNVSLSSGFRHQKYKRLDYPKAPTLLRDPPPEVRAVPHTPPETFSVKRQGRNKAGRKQTTEMYTFVSQKDALEFELAPSAVLRQTIEKRLASLSQEQRELKAEMETQIARAGGVFAVRKGLVPGIYLHWDKVVRETGKMSQSEWKKLETVQEAQEWMGMYHVSPEDVCYDPFASRISFLEHLLSDEAKLEPEKKRWFAVKKGRQPGVYSNWEEAADQVIGYSGAVYASFSTDKQACKFLGMSKKEYFEQLKQDPTETDKEMIRQKRLADEQLQAYKRERDRIKFSQYAEAKMYIAPPDGGSPNRVKQLLTKCLQIQAEINKMVSLDKMRKFHMQDIFDELDQMTEEEKQECLESLDNSHLVDAYNVFNNPEYWDFYREYLLTKENYLGYESTTCSKGRGDTLFKSEFRECGTTKSTTEELAATEVSQWRQKNETSVENDTVKLDTSSEGFFSSTQELSERTEDTVDKKLTQRQKRDSKRATLKALDKSISENIAAPDDVAIGIKENGTVRNQAKKTTFENWLDGFSEAEKHKPASKITLTGHFKNATPQMRREMLKARHETKMELVARTADPSTTVTLDMLAGLTCNCGEPVFVRNRDSSAAAPLIPRRQLYLSTNRYKNLHGDSGWTNHTFKHKQADFDINTTSFRDHHDHKLLRAFETNWRIMFNSLSKQLGPIAANHAGRYDDVEANVVYTDGSHNALPSPLLYNAGAAGWGVHFEKGLMPDACGRVPGEQTPGRAEILAMVMAIRIISRHMTYRSQKWEIRTDSLWTLRLLEHGWEGLEPTERMRSHPNYYLIKRLRALLYENQNISLRFIRSQHMHSGARIADKLAKKGARKKYSETAEQYGTDDEDIFIHDPALSAFFPSATVPSNLRSSMWTDNKEWCI